MKTKTPGATKRIIPATRTARSGPLPQPKMVRASLQKQALPAKSTGTSGSVSAAISMVFQKDEALRSAIKEQLKKRIPTVDVSKRAKKVFDNFKPSSYPPSVRAAQNFLAHGGNLTHAQQGAMDRGLKALRHSSTKGTMTLRQTEALGSLMQTKKKSGNGAPVGTISLPNLISYVNTKVPQGRLIARSSPITTCKAQIEAKAAMQSITNPKDSTAPTDNAGTNPAADPNQNDDTGKIATSDFSHLTATQVVKDNVGLQMKTATSPESQVMYAIPNKNPTGNIDTFELRQGPSDVTSYHDFNTLQIAFESVWTEIIDSRLTALGQQLYEEYVKLKVFTGTDDGTDLQMSTLDDLTDLMDTIKSFTNTIVDSLPPNLQPPDTSGTSADSGTSLQNTVIDTVATVATGGLYLIFEQALKALADSIGRKPILTWEQLDGRTLEGGFQIVASFEDAVVDAGLVQFVLETDRQSWKKQIAFQWFDDTTNRFENLFFVDNRALNSAGADTQSFFSAPVSPSFLDKGCFEFDSEDDFHQLPGRFILGGLSEKLKGGSRVTFYWKGVK